MTDTSDPSPLASAPRLPLRAMAVLLLGLLLVGAIPGWLRGRWPWERAELASDLAASRNLPETGINLPGWETLSKDAQRIGGGNWVVQDVRRPSDAPGGGSDRAVVMLLPMRALADRPQVEWTDWQGLAKLTVDRRQQVRLRAETDDGETAEFSALLSRGWTPENETYIMLQWYAWPGGGSPDPADWFWADWAARWQGEQLPWMAVNVLVPTDRPLDDIEPYRETIEDVGRAVQSGLESGPLAERGS